MTWSGTIVVIFKLSTNVLDLLSLIDWMIVDRSTDCLIDLLNNYLPFVVD